MKLRGNRVYLELPKREESLIELTPELEEIRAKEEIKKFNRLKVYAVGDAVLDLKTEDEVLVMPDALTKASIVPLGDELSVLLVSSFDICHIW